MRRWVSLVAIVALLLAACGGGDESDATIEESESGAVTDQTDSNSGSDGAEGGGEVADLQPPGQAVVSVDGEEYMFDTLGPVGCNVSDSEINAGFIFGDNEVSFIAGGSASGSEWRGRIDLNVQKADGIANYFADFSNGSGDSVAVDGESMSYSGEWQVFQPGTSEAESVGQGTLSFTCG